MICNGFIFIHMDHYFAYTLLEHFRFLIPILDTWLVGIQYGRMLMEKCLVISSKNYASVYLT